MPALINLTATRRLTGSVCWAIQTLPMPPSPICSMSLYGPITVPGLSVAGWSMVAMGVAAAGRSSRLSGLSAAASSASRWAIRASSAAARIPDVLMPTVRVWDVAGGVEDCLVVGW